MRIQTVSNRSTGESGALRKTARVLFAGAILGGVVFAYQYRWGHQAGGAQAATGNAGRSGSESGAVAGLRVKRPTITREERAAAYRSAIEKGGQLSDWPKTPEDVIRSFWDAASRKDYDKMALLSPGSVTADFKTYYDKFTPSPPKSIGAPEPHPKVSGVMLYPVTVPFPWFPNKTLKMAVSRTSDGRPVIDGRNSIWW